MGAAWPKTGRRVTRRREDRAGEAGDAAGARPETSRQHRNHASRTAVTNHANPNVTGFVALRNISK